MFNTGKMVITDDTHSHFYNTFMSVYFNLQGGHCLYNFNLSMSPPILGLALMIAARRHDLRCDDPSSSRYGEPFR